MTKSYHPPLPPLPSWYHHTTTTTTTTVTMTTTTPNNIGSYNTINNKSHNNIRMTTTTTIHCTFGSLICNMYNNTSTFNRHYIPVPPCSKCTNSVSIHFVPILVARLLVLLVLEPVVVVTIDTMFDSFGFVVCMPMRRKIP